VSQQTSSDGARPAAPIAQGKFRTVLGHFASGVVVVTGTHEGQPAGFTCQSFFSLSLDPPLVAIAPAKSSTSWPKIAAGKTFCLNILSEEQEAICWAFAGSGGDKFAGVGWSPASTGAPRLNDVLAWIDCTLEEVHDAGDHVLVVGRVVELDAVAGEPLLFYRGGFGGFRS
jgi:flavin reductase (DIM6/NTAB) family NADH-FMN oxidoreductase RutF